MNPGISSYVLGLDVGTTSIKGVLLSDKGDFIASAGQEYMIESGPNDTCELEPNVYWQVCCVVIGEILQQSEIDPALIKGISFSSQGETLIVVDKFGKPLRKAIVWLDNRSVTEAQEITDYFGNKRIMEITGQPEVVATWPATRIIWLKKNEPKIFANAHKFLLVEDYLIYKLTGKYCAEHSLLSSTLYFDITRKVWWNEMLSFMGITSEQLPQIMTSGTVVANIHESAANVAGLSTSTMVVTGSYDHPSGAIGAGNIAPGMATLTIGASMAMCITLDKPVSDLSLTLSCQCHAIPGLYFLLPYSQTAGLVLKWFKDEFCNEEVNIARQINADAYSIIVEQALQVPPGAEGLTMLPHLMGTGSPEFNPKVKGVFAGITLGMKKGHFVRAILEAVVTSIERNLDMMKQNGILIKEIHVLGGGSKNALWNQILADMTGIRVVTMSQHENASIGAAILAGLGTGVFKDLTIACNSCNRIAKEFEPNPGNYESYRVVYERYIKLYQTMEHYW